MAPKKIPKSRVFQHFMTLPERQRVELLRRHMAPAVLDELGRAEFDVAMYALRDKPEAETRKALQPLKACHKSMVNAAKQNTGAFTDTILNKYGARSTDEDRLYALITSNTMENRLRLLWPGVDDQRKKPYVDKGVAGMTDAKQLGKLMDHPESFAKGKSLDSFLADVQKTMDLSKEKSTIDYLREGAPQNDPDQAEKFQRAAQMYMFQPQSDVDPADIAQKLQGKNWKKDVDPLKTLKKKMKGSYVDPSEVVGHIKKAMAEIPETDKEKELFRSAALETCKGLKEEFSLSQTTIESEEGREFLKYTEELQTEMTTEALKEKPVRDLRDSFAGEYATLKKVKTGYFLSKTDSPEHKTMMKNLRLFNAKLDLMEGKEPQDLEAGELETVKNTEADVLYHNARKGVYDYGCMKTGNGTKSIWHTAGTERFDSSMKVLENLGELGKKLHLTSPASAVRDEVQLQLLQNRGDKNWMKQNIEDITAKTICAQVLNNKGIPGYQHQSAFKTEVENIKASGAFKQMMKTVSHDKLAAAMIKGGNTLAEVYQKSANALKAAGKGANREQDGAELDPQDLAPKKNDTGLVSPVR